MSTFQLTAYPCTVLPGGTAQILITSCLTRLTVDCDYSEVAAKMADLGHAMIIEHGAMHPEIYVSAAIKSRMVNGWKNIVTARKDQQVFRKGGSA